VLRERDGKSNGKCGQEKKKHMIKKGESADQGGIDEYKKEKNGKKKDRPALRGGGGVREKKDTGEKGGGETYLEIKIGEKFPNGRGERKCWGG